MAVVVMVMVVVLLVATGNKACKTVAYSNQFKLNFRLS